MKTKLFLMIGALAVLLMAFVPFGQAKQVFGWVIAEKLTVQQGGAIIESGGLTVRDGNVTIPDNLIISAQTAISVTDGLTVTTTGGYQPLESGGTVTMTLTVPSAGALIHLTNTSNTTINLADSGNVKLSAAWAAGQYDTISLLSDGTYLLEVARSNN